MTFVVFIMKKHVIEWERDKDWGWDNEEINSYNIIGTDRERLNKNKKINKKKAKLYWYF